MFKYCVRLVPAQGHNGHRGRVAIQKIRRIETLAIKAVGDAGSALGHADAFACRRGKSQHGDVAVIVLDRLGLRKRPGEGFCGPSSVVSLQVSICMESSGVIQGPPLPE